MPEYVERIRYDATAPRMVTSSSFGVGDSNTGPSKRDDNTCMIYELSASSASTARAVSLLLQYQSLHV